uniref:Uncharacterized protein n=1 Tax=Acrobeloides nanus TaxID=290746 RepID=A0A914D3Z1_9BILA
MTVAIVLPAVLLLPVLLNAFPHFGPDPFNPLGPWHKRTLHCGLPRFLHKLPEEIQEQIKKIWENYQEGEECFKEQKETRKILHEIPDEVRHRIFKGMCGPSFLRNASETIRTEFKKVWFDAKMTIEEKEVAFKKLAYSLLTGDALAQFNKWEAALQERKKENEERIQKEAYDKWQAMRKEERIFLANLDPEIRAELKLLCGFCGTYKHGPGMFLLNDDIDAASAILRGVEEDIEGSECVLYF